MSELDDLPLAMQARSLTRQYAVSRGWLRPPAVVRALNGVSFDLPTGRTLAVVGESGSGKSTLARQLTLIETPTSGSLSLAGREIGARDRSAAKDLRSSVQMVFQNPYASLNPRQSIATTLDEPLAINTRLSRAERRERVVAMAQRVGLRPEQLGRYPHMFSGGQRQRVAIARAMMLQPKVVVADEPVSALDVSIQAQILNLFMDLQDETGAAYVFISHNLGVVEHVAHQVAVMVLGAFVEIGARERIFARPLHPYTQALLAAAPAIRPADRHARVAVHGEAPNPLAPPGGCAYRLRCPLAALRCAEAEPGLREVDGRLVACHLL